MVYLIVPYGHCLGSLGFFCPFFSTIFHQKHRGEEPPWLHLGKHKKFSICEKWYASTWKTFLKTQKKPSNIQLPPNSNKNGTHIRSENGFFPRFVRREVDLSFRFGGGDRQKRRKIRCFIWRLNPGAILDGFASSLYLGDRWMVATGGALPPRYLEDPGIPESLQVCVTFVPFALFHLEKTLAILAEVLLGGVILFFTKRVSGTCNIHELKWLLQFDDAPHLYMQNGRFTKHPLKNCSANA